MSGAATLERPPAPELTEREDTFDDPENPCHILNREETGTLCGAKPRGGRRHWLSECRRDGHIVCEACEALRGRR